MSIFWTPGGDTADYAKQFEELFESIGFRTLRVGRPGIYTGLKHDNHYGLWVRHEQACYRSRVPPIGSAVVAALEQAAIDEVIDFDFEGNTKHVLRSHAPGSLAGLLPVGPAR